MLPTWDQALDAIGPHDDPLHVARFGAKFDAQGVLAGSKDAGRCIRYLTKYLTKHVADCHQADTDAQRAHAAGWPTRCGTSHARRRARTGCATASSRRTPSAGLRPGACKGKAHRPEHLGYAGRRVLVSRKWSGKTLADHRGDRKAWLVETLGLEAPDPARYTWHVVTPADRDYLPPDKRLLHIVADRARWQAALTEARRRAKEPGGNLSATGSGRHDKHERGRTTDRSGSC